MQIQPGILLLWVTPPQEIKESCSFIFVRFFALLGCNCKKNSHKEPAQLFSVVCTSEWGCLELKQGYNCDLAKGMKRMHRDVLVAPYWERLIVCLGPSFRFQKVLTSRRRHPGKEKNNGSFTLWDHGIQRWIGVSLANTGKRKMCSV